MKWGTGERHHQMTILQPGRRKRKTLKRAREVQSFGPEEGKPVGLCSAMKRKKRKTPGHRKRRCTSTMNRKLKRKQESVSQRMFERKKREKKIAYLTTLRNSRFRGDYSEAPGGKEHQGDQSSCRERRKEGKERNSLVRPHALRGTNRTCVIGEVREKDRLKRMNRTHHTLKEIKIFSVCQVLTKPIKVV